MLAMTLSVYGLRVTLQYDPLLYSAYEMFVCWQVSHYFSQGL